MISLVRYIKYKFIIMITLVRYIGSFTSGAFSRRSMETSMERCETRERTWWVDQRKMFKIFFQIQITEKYNMTPISTWGREERRFPDASRE